ncbi:SUKH-3 domain-containing protein [Metabacillus fastidiosus]|uniref:SUKH-3 domain-containing protein n=1 Tax=Metabacillus fastidiosus TaxID=1458 RepID=UPI003D2C27F7
MENKIRDLLQKSEWFEGRKIDISQYLNFLNDEEYYIFEKAINFFKEYGDLIIEFENPKRSGSYVTLVIDPVHVGSSIFREVSKRYERYCNESFVIVGEIPLMEMTWYVSSSGAFYGGNDDFLIHLGDDFYQALYNIVSEVRLEVINIED